MSRHLASSDLQSLRSQRFAVAMAGLALVIGLVFTGLGVFWVHSTIQRQARERFELLVERVRADVQEHLNAPLQGLHGAAGVYAASSAVMRDEFRAYVQFSELARDFPGVRGFGFMVRVMRSELDSFVAAVRADGEPAFAVHAMSGGPATDHAPDLYVVQFLEPQAGNQASLGLDAGADALRREAIEHAIATGEPTLSKKTTLVQDRQQQAGWLYLLPVYRVGSAPATPAQRKAALLGVLFAPMVVSEALQGAALATQGQADFELFDAERASAEALVYDLDGHLAVARGNIMTTHYTGRLFSASRLVAVGGRNLSLRVSTTPAFEAGVVSPLPLLLGLGGVALSLLLAFCIWLLGSSRARALSVAQHMTLSLAREQQRLLSIVEGTNVGTWEWNIQTGETRLDERWATITGHTLNELQPLDIQSWRSLMHPGDLVGADLLLKRHFAGKTPYFDCEMRMRHKTGHWVWVLSRGRVCAWTRERRAALMAGTLMDITERQAAQLALRNSEEHFRQLFETSLESILQARPDGQVTHANPAACELFGMTVEALRQRGPRGLVDPQDTRLKAFLDERQREGRARSELRMVRGDGTVFECEVSSSIFLDPNNAPCANIVLRDITARKRSEARIVQLNAELEQRVGRRTAELEASNRDLQEFAYSVAHDLRQPFIAIGGFSGLLERWVTDERGKHYIQRIKAGVRQAGELTEALLALANLSRVQLRVQPVDLSAIARRVVDTLQQEDTARAADISIQDGLVVQGDPMLLGLVMEELLSNAWKFTSRQNRTDIRFAALPAQAGDARAETVYVLRDNGEGFDMAHADKLFRSFQRLHAAQDFPGAGVGLANIQRIIARHGGRIWAESAQGEGACFFFTLGHAGL
ncbi:CHASE domain-containing protein [Polaromonas sp.]|uniref:CHASE domain-containing protein n=1 Tax=Polaromonas sp. TaxID=1869339 RepID=UPI003266C7EA